MPKRQPRTVMMWCVAAEGLLGTGLRAGWLWQADGEAGVVVVQARAAGHHEYV